MGKVIIFIMVLASLASAGRVYSLVSMGTIWRDANSTEFFDLERNCGEKACALIFSSRGNGETHVFKETNHLIYGWCYIDPDDGTRLVFQSRDEATITYKGSSGVFRIYRQSDE